MFKIKGLTKINMANRVLYACTVTVATPQRDLEMVDSRSKELAVKPLKLLFHIIVEFTTSGLLSLTRFCCKKNLLQKSMLLSVLA